MRDEFLDDAPMEWMMGSVSTLNPLPTRKVPPREFPPGFHVAAPGPSHPEYESKPRRRKSE